LNLYPIQMKALNYFNRLRTVVLVLLTTGLYSLFIPVEIYAQETPEEWVALAQQYLNSNPPEYENAADAYVCAGDAALDLEPKDVEAAEGYFEEALKISLSRDFHSISGRAYDGLGEVESEKGDYTKAIEYHLEAAKKFLEVEDYYGAGWAYLYAGRDAGENGDVTAAISWLEEASMNFLRGDYYANAGFAYMLIGWMMVVKEEYEKAIGYYMEAVEISIEGEVDLNAAAAYAAAGDAAKANLDCTTANTYWEKAKEYYDKIGKPYTIPSCELEIIIENPGEDSTFIQGEVIHLEGKVLYAETQVAPSNSKVKYEIVVPDCNTHQKGREKYTDTDESGNFSVMSFAGWNMGKYQLVVSAEYMIESEQREVSASTTVSFNVVKPELSDDLSAQLANILNHYYQAIAEGPIRTNPEAQDYLNALTICQIVGGYENICGEDKYGSLHNMFLVNSYDSKVNFTCVGYQSQVLKLLDKIRYNEDINVRNWLSGLDYTPISRGINVLREFGFHVAVALYRIGFDWKSDQHTIILDPWYNQKPTVYSINDWCLMGVWALPLLAPKFPWIPQISSQFEEITDITENIWEGYPLTGNVICSSFTSYGNVYEPLLKYKVMINCPVTLLVTDSLGNQMGVLPDKSLIQDFAGSMYCSSDEGEVSGWYIELPDYTYDLTITGESDGEFHVSITGEGVGGEYLYYGAQTITENGQATIHLGSGILKPDLVLPDGTLIQPLEVTSGTGNSKVIPEGESIMNYPNPFTDLTHITYKLHENTFVKIDIYNTTGKLIRTLVQEHKPSGQYTVIWNGKNHLGRTVDSGIYFGRIITNYRSETQKMILMR